jgi:hypothetical protein
MQFKRGDKQAASQSFAEAILTDPKVSLAPYDQPDLRAEWNATRDEAVAVSQPQPTGDFDTQAPLEQAVNTPVPIYVTYRGGAALQSVVAKYRGEGDVDWKRVDLVRRGQGWAGLIPCSDVRRGVIRYYVQGIDSTGTPSVMSGDPKIPFIVPIRHAITAKPPAFPGEAPPAKCAPGGTCPPEEPNCNAPPPQVSHAEEVPQCDEDSQCSSGVCEDGRCVEQKPDVSRDYARWWVGLAGSIDLTLMPSGDDVCALASKSALPLNGPGYYCTFPNGSDYPSRQSANENASLTPGQAGHVDGGPAFAAIRVLLAVDYALSAKLLVGVRAGYVAHSYPGSAAGGDGHGFTKPVHLEARGTYLFGDAPLAHAGLAPMVFGAVGIAEFAAEKDVMVRQGNPPLAVNGLLPRQAWLVGGPAFLAVGAGGRYAFSQRWGFTMAAKLSGAFGSAGFTPTLAPELGLQYGF